MTFFSFLLLDVEGLGQRCVIILLMIIAVCSLKPRLLMSLFVYACPALLRQQPLLRRPSFSFSLEHACVRPESVFLAVFSLQDHAANAFATTSAFERSFCVHAFAQSFCVHKHRVDPFEDSWDTSVVYKVVDTIGA